MSRYKRDISEAKEQQMRNRVWRSINNSKRPPGLEVVEIAEWSNGLRVNCLIQQSVK